MILRHDKSTGTLKQEHQGFQFTDDITHEGTVKNRVHFLEKVFGIINIFDEYNFAKSITVR